MEASEMLDVIHYFFEEDVSMKAQEELNSRNNLRSSLYDELYSGMYGKSVPSTQSNDLSNLDDEEDFEMDAPVEPFNPRKPKSYVPPTPMSDNAAKPFGDILDAPIG